MSEQFSNDDILAFGAAEDVAVILRASPIPEVDQGVMVQAVQVERQVLIRAAIGVALLEHEHRLVTELGLVRKLIKGEVTPQPPYMGTVSERQFRKDLSGIGISKYQATRTWGWLVRYFVHEKSGHAQLSDYRRGIVPFTIEFQTYEAEKDPGDKTQKNILQHKVDNLDIGSLTVYLDAVSEVYQEKQYKLHEIAGQQFGSRIYDALTRLVDFYKSGNAIDSSAQSE